MTLKLEYEQVLRNFLTRHGEIDLMNAYELGKQFQNQQTSPDELVGLHLDALAKLPPEMPEGEKLDEVMRSFSVLIETMIAYGIAYSDAYRLLAATAREAEDAKFELERTIVDLDLANQQLQDVDRVKTKFFSNLSHELRTPLNAIIGFAEDAIDGMAGELNPKQQRYVNNILTAGRHLLTVINDILDLAKLSAGKVQLDLQPVAMPVAAGEIEEMLAPLIMRKRQIFEVDVPTDLPLVLADPAKLRQILLNLASNAHKFTPDEGRIGLRARAEGDRVRVEVSDTGIGISPKDLPTLFEEFRQVGGSERPKGQQGTGLGLAITKRLVERHGGTIGVESTLGGGTKVYFDLPVAPEAD